MIHYNKNIKKIPYKNLLASLERSFVFTFVIKRRCLFASDNNNK